MANLPIEPPSPLDPPLSESEIDRSEFMFEKCWENETREDETRHYYLAGEVIDYNRKEFRGADFITRHGQIASTLAVAMAETIDVYQENQETIVTVLGAMTMLTFMRHRANVSTVTYNDPRKSHQPELTSKTDIFWCPEFDRQVADPLVTANLFIDTFQEYFTKSPYVTNRQLDRKKLAERWTRLGDNVRSEIYHGKTQFLVQ